MSIFVLTDLPGPEAAPRETIERLWRKAIHRVLCQAYWAYPEIEATLCVDAIRRCSHDRCDLVLQIWDWMLGSGARIMRERDGD